MTLSYHIVFLLIYGSTTALFIGSAHLTWFALHGDKIKYKKGQRRFNELSKEKHPIIYALYLIIFLPIGIITSIIFILLLLILLLGDNELDKSSFYNSDLDVKMNIIMLGILGTAVLYLMILIIKRAVKIIKCAIKFGKISINRKFYSYKTKKYRFLIVIIFCISSIISALTYVYYYLNLSEVLIVQLTNIYL